jgi:hypothetical protein
LIQRACETLSTEGLLSAGLEQLAHFIVLRRS